MRHFHSSDKNKTACGREYMPKDWVTHRHDCVSCPKCLVIVYNLVLQCTVCDWKGQMKDSMCLFPNKKRICAKCWEAGQEAGNPQISLCKDAMGAFVCLGPKHDWEPEE